MGGLGSGGAHGGDGGGNAQPQRFRSSAEVARYAKGQEIMRYLLTGHSLKECTQLADVSRATVQKICTDPVFVAELKRLSAETYEELDKQLGALRTTVHTRIEELSMKALDKFEELLDSEKPAIVYKVGQDILDRNPELPRNRRVEGDFKHKVFDPAALLHAANVARELDDLSDSGGKTIDGDTRSE